jgi:hypothetical protein
VAAKPLKLLEYLKCDEVLRDFIEEDMELSLMPSAIRMMNLLGTPLLPRGVMRGAGLSRLIGAGEGAAMARGRKARSVEGRMLTMVAGSMRY